MYRKVAEAKFLAKACVIITDGIRKRETQEASRQVLPFVYVCVHARVCVGWGHVSSGANLHLIITFPGSDNKLFGYNHFISIRHEVSTVLSHSDMETEIQVHFRKKIMQMCDVNYLSQK